MAWIGEQDLGTKAVSAIAPAMVTLRIDGQDVAVPEGTSIMRAAALVGTDIPKLCATDALEAFGQSVGVAIERPTGQPGGIGSTIPGDRPVVERQPEEGQLLVVGRRRRQPLEAVAQLVGQVADEPAEEGRRIQRGAHEF